MEQLSHKKDEVVDSNTRKRSHLSTTIHAWPFSSAIGLNIGVNGYYGADMPQHALGWLMQIAIVTSCSYPFFIYLSIFKMQDRPAIAQSVG